MSEQFSRDTMLSTIKVALDDGSRTLENIQMETTNNDLWIIGTYQAAEALEKFDGDDMLLINTNLLGVFGAIEYVTYYEDNNFGEINTDLSDPEKVASVVAYINMDITLNDLINEFDLDWDDDLTSQQVDEIKKYISEEIKQFKDIKLRSIHKRVDLLLYISFENQRKG